MDCTNRSFRSGFHSVARGLSAAASCATLLALGQAAAQAPLRCDLQLTSTPGAAAGTACLDLVALQTGGAPIVTADNATRISVDGFKLCKNAFEVSKPAGADIVFIYDNSGSMWSHWAKINAAKGDTSFFDSPGCRGAGGGGGGGTPTSTPMVYNTVLGPRTVHLVDSTATCTEIAGDPYFARTQVISQAIDYLTTNSPTSAVGAVAFAADTGHVRSPLPLSVAGNAALIKASLGIDSIPDTRYVPPLTLAAKWLNDTSITNTAKQAIVFISDGQPNDGTQLTPWINANKNIPIYTIALGDSTAPFTRMQDMSTQTGGRFYRVSPKDPARMNQVMQEIIQAITIPTIPRSIEVTNSSITPPMVSRSTGMARNPDSSITPVMDSILALNKGLNNLTVKITMSDNDIRTYTVKVQADGPAAATSGQSLSCHAMPTLTLLSAAGGVDSAYTAATTPYTVKLTRATSDLQQVIVVATSSDTSRRGWGDEEHIVLPQTSASGGTTINLKNGYPLNGSAANVVKGNNTLEAAPGPGGSVTLTWQHPRDPREIATYRLPGKSISTTQGFINVARAVDAPQGVPVPPEVKDDPVVIRGGVTLVRKGATATLTHKGVLSKQKLGDDILDPNHTPTFVFSTAAPFTYSISVYDHLGQFMNSNQGAVDSAAWDKMRAGADSLACAFSILPISKDGHRFGTGVYILRATIITHESVRQDVGRPMRVTAVTRSFVNRFGYIR